MMVMMRKIVIPGKLKTMMTVKPHKAIKTKSFVMVMMNFWVGVTFYGGSYHLIGAVLLLLLPLVSHCSCWCLDWW